MSWWLLLSKAGVFKVIQTLNLLLNFFKQTPTNQELYLSKIAIDFLGYTQVKTAYYEPEIYYSTFVENWSLLNWNQKILITSFLLLS